MQRTEETLQPRARCTKESFVLLQQHTHTHTKHTSASRTPDVAERCRSKAVGDWKSESCIHLRLCAASLELHCTSSLCSCVRCEIKSACCVRAGLQHALLGGAYRLEPVSSGQGNTVFKRCQCDITHWFWTQHFNN